MSIHLHSLLCVAFRQSSNSGLIPSLPYPIGENSKAICSYNPTSDPLTTFRPSRVITFVEYGCKYKRKELYICDAHFFLKGFSSFLPSGYSGGELRFPPLFSLIVVCTLFILSGAPQKIFLTSWRCECGDLLQLAPRLVMGFGMHRTFKNYKSWQSHNLKFTLPI
jgi:hypothetical protein